MSDWLTEWLTNWLIWWLIQFDWLIVWLNDCVIKWLSEWQSVILSINQSVSQSVGQLTGWLTDCVSELSEWYFYYDWSMKHCFVEIWNSYLESNVKYRWYDLIFQFSEQQCWFPSFRCSLSHDLKPWLDSYNFLKFECNNTLWFPVFYVLTLLGRVLDTIKFVCTVQVLSERKRKRKFV